MISDEELQEMVETEGRDYAEPEQLIEAMATELLQLREEKRQAEEAREIAELKRLQAKCPTTERGEA